MLLVYILTVLNNVSSFVFLQKALSHPPMIGIFHYMDELIFSLTSFYDYNQLYAYNN